ncbi:hypothetical protein Moror_1876, partial [Moniliophthora roreri MCA 2997]
MSSPDVHPPCMSSPDLQPPHTDPPGLPQPCADLPDPDPLDINTFPTSSIDNITTIQEFIRQLRNATLERSGLTPEAIEHLRNPPTEPINVEMKAQKPSIQLYLSHSQMSEAKYKELIEVIMENFPPQSKDKELLLYYWVKKLVRDITGIKPIKNDMCPKTCISYVAQFDDLDTCPFCRLPWIDPITKRPQKFSTIPFGMKKLLEELELNSEIDEIDDICCREDVLNAVKEEKIGLDDTVVMVTLDGCQLYQSKASDCWVFSYILVVLLPDKWYKKKYFILSAIFPGPNKSKVMESFLFVALYYIAAITNDGGLCIWDAHWNLIIISCIFILFALADCPEMVHWSGLVVHTGKIGCQLWCPLIGRHKPNQHMYYPVLYKPTALDVEESNHADQDSLRLSLTPIDAECYVQSLHVLSDEEGITIISVFDIQAVVAMLLHCSKLLGPKWEGKVFAVDRPAVDDVVQVPSPAPTAVLETPALTSVLPQNALPTESKAKGKEPVRPVRACVKGICALTSADVSSNLIQSSASTSASTASTSKLTEMSSLVLKAAPALSVDTSSSILSANSALPLNVAVMFGLPPENDTRFLTINQNQLETLFAAIRAHQSQSSNSTDMPLLSPLALDTPVLPSLKVNIDKIPSTTTVTAIDTDTRHSTMNDLTLNPSTICITSPNTTNASTTIKNTDSANVEMTGLNATSPTAEPTSATTTTPSVISVSTLSLSVLHTPAIPLSKQGARKLALDDGTNNG